MRTPARKVSGAADRECKRVAATEAAVQTDWPFPDVEERPPSTGRGIRMLEQDGWQQWRSAVATDRSATRRSRAEWW